VDPEPELDSRPSASRRRVRNTRAKVSAGDFLVFDNEEDADWDKAEPEEDEPVTTHSRRSSRRRARTSSPRTTRRARRGHIIDDEDEDSSEESNSPEPELSSDEDIELSRQKANKKKRPTRRVKKLLPEDVYGRPEQDQPVPDPQEVQFSPSVAFIAIFVAVFVDLFTDIPALPSPQDIEEGLVAPLPTDLVEFLFRRLLGLVLNRKKDIEVGKYGSALSELHSLRNTLGMSPSFPPLNWKAKSEAFSELSWADRVELLHVLIHWSLTSSERVKALLRNMPVESTLPWMGADDQGNHYYIVGFDPIGEGSEEYTRFRVYKETNRLLNTVKWEPIASNVSEVLEFLKAHEIKSEEQLEAERLAAEEAEKRANMYEAKGVSDSAAGPDTTGTPEVTAEGTHEAPNGSAEAAETEPAEPAEAIEPVEPPSYDLPDTVVEILQNLIPAMQRSEEVRSDRLLREAKKARKRREIQVHAEAVARGEGRYALRSRRRRPDYSEMLRNAYGEASDGDDEDDDDSRAGRRKRRLRQRGSDYAWGEPEPETRQQRHARLLAERAERDFPRASEEPDGVEELEESDEPEGYPDETVPDEEPDMSDTPMGETPVGDTPVSETPVGDTPVSETPVGDTPVSETPAGETLGGEHPIGSNSISEHPVATNQQLGMPNITNSLAPDGQNGIFANGFRGNV